ncbi:MAG: MATE family efflux transporter [Faecalimonas sp.]|nr:MATE family efflux transporter [Faecalimonas sp.]
MQTNNLLTESVSKIFFRYLIPAILANMVTSIYILADTIIIGKGIGTLAMAALNIILPLFNIFFGVGLLFGVGGSVLMSIARGRGDEQLGKCYFTLSIILNAITCLILTVLLWIFMEPVVLFLGATEATLPYIRDYAPYVILGLSAFAFSSLLQTFVRNDGAPRLAMIAVVSGGVLNVILDLIFVFPLQMKMAGAAIASVIGSLCTICILLLHFLSKTNGLNFSLKGFSLSCIGRIFQNGFTSFLVDITSGIVMFVFNIKILEYAGDNGVSMYGVICNTAIIVVCLCNGINQAAQPILSTNYGAGFTKRIGQIRSLGIKTALIICALPTILGLIMPNMFTYIFLNPNEEILAMSPTAIRIYFIGFLAMGINMFVVGYFQSTAKPKLSLLVCLARGCVLSIIFVTILAPTFGINGIWASVPLAEFVTLLISIYFLVGKSMRQTNMKEEIA